MKRFKIIPWLRIAGALLSAGFLLRLGADWYQYDAGLYSAPFWVFALVRAVEFLLPALICLMAAWILKRRKRRSAF